MSENANIINKIKRIFTNSSGPAIPLAGLDIDASSLLAVEMAGNPNKPKIKGIAASSLHPGTLIEDQIQNPLTFKESLIQLKQQFPKMASSTAISMPGRFVITKRVGIPANLTENQLNRVAWHQAKKVFPGMVDELYLDYVTLKETKPSAGLLIIAARKKELDVLIKAIEDAGMNTKVIDIDCYALARAYQLIAKQLPESHVDQYIGLLNINTQHMTLSIMNKKTIAYCRQQSYNEEGLVPLVQTLLGLESEGSHMEGQEHPLAPVQEELLISNLQELLQLFLSERPDVSLSHLVISGRCALIPHLDQLIQEKTGINTLLADPFVDVKFTTSIDTTKLTKQAPAYLLACGLAMRGL